jgi:hypothetical protein
MTETMFEIPPPARNTTHACGGPGCQFCQWLDGQGAKAKGVQAVNYDPRWLIEATDWRRTRVGLEVTADDLVEAIGLPDGHPNQIGALFARWAQSGFIRLSGVRRSHRDSNHARQIRVWEVQL